MIDKTKTDDRYYDKREFSYPVFIVSEDYHVIKQKKGLKNLDLEIQMNRRIDDQISHLELSKKL